jgi:hypothetical protein
MCCVIQTPAQGAELASPLIPVKIISCGGGGWKDGQVQEPCLLVNPKDTNKLILFYAGMTLGDGVGCHGKAWANVSEPFNWHEDNHNPLLQNDPHLAWEGGSLRLDSVLYNDALDEYWVYYTGGYGDSVNLATCPAGPDGYSAVTTAHFKRYEGNPILTPKGQGRDDGNCVSQGAVFRERGRWYMFYSYRNDKILPGIRLATATDGKHWTKVPGPDLLSAAPEQRYLEWHQVYKIDNRYLLLYEGYNGGVRWGADLAVSTNLTNGWKKLRVDLFDQTKWQNYSNETLFHVATPAIYRIGNRWRLYFQAAPAGEYTSQHWNLWGLDCDDVVRQLPIYQAN